MAYDRSDRGSSVPGWPLLAAGLTVFWLIVLAPALLVGGAGALLWRRQGWRGRWALPLLGASLLPVVAASRLERASALELLLRFVDTQGAVGFALLGGLLGFGGGMPYGLSLGDYVSAVGPLLPLLSVLTGAGVALLTGPRQPRLQRREAAGVAVPRRVERRAAAGVEHPGDGWALGYRSDGRALVLDDALCRHHVLVCGATGSGKTTVLRHLLDGVAGRGPLVVLDCKASTSLRRAVEAVPGALVWEIGGDLRWDALRGDPTTFAAKLVVAEQFSPQAAVYRVAAERYAQAVGRVLAWRGEPRDPRLVAELLDPPALLAALSRLEREVDPGWWLAHGEPLRRRVECMGRAEAEGVAGFALRFGLVAEGAAGPSLGAGPGALALEDAVRAGRTVLFSLDAAAYPTLAAKIGAWVMIDLVRVAGLLQARGRAGAGEQLYAVVDEFSALRDEGRHVVPLLARAREAGVACVVATQGLADLAAVDRALPQQVVQNTGVRILLRQGSGEDALAWARHLGEHEREEVSRQLEHGGFPGGLRDSGRATTRWRRAYHVPPEELQVLAVGDAVVHVAASGARRACIERVRVARPRDLPPPDPLRPPPPQAPPAPRRTADRFWAEADRPSPPDRRPPPPAEASKGAAPPRRGVAPVGDLGITPAEGDG